MNTISDRIDEVLDLAKKLKLLSSFNRSKTTNDQIKETIQTMEQKLQTVWISTVEFNTDSGESRKKV